jgi:hypothetical protein
MNFIIVGMIRRASRCYNGSMTRMVLAMSCLLPLSVLAATLDKPIYTESFLQNPSQKVVGNVTDWDSQGVTIHSANEDREIKWVEMTPASAYVLRSRLIDKSNANEWLDLGEMGWKMGATEQARVALATAVKLNATLKDRVAQILANPTTKPTKELLKPASPPVMYIKSTPEQDAAAIKKAQEFEKKVADTLVMKFTEVQTPHFIVFTDWDPREMEFLKKNIEAAYGAVSKQFDIPVKENVFVGKLPVLMFAHQTDFMRYAQEFDDLPANKTLLGYYASHGDGTGHMAMWKPYKKLDSAQGANPEEQWAYTLTHEFTHAFVDRYKSSRRIPRWLNEGLAEVIAQTQFPQQGRHELAREMALNRNPVDQLFSDEYMPTGEYYPVMQTMVEMLIKQDRKGFIRFFDAIKDGEKPEAALKDVYGMDYRGLVKGWRNYIVRVSD